MQVRVARAVAQRADARNVSRSVVRCRAGNAHLRLAHRADLRRVRVQRRIRAQGAACGIAGVAEVAQHAAARADDLRLCLEQLADVRRAVRDVAAAAQPQVVVDAPVEHRLVRFDGLRWVVVRVAVAELDAELLEDAGFGRQRQQQLPVYLRRRHLALRVAAREDADRAVQERRLARQAILNIEVRVLALRQTACEPRLTRPHVDELALHVELGDL